MQDGPLVTRELLLGLQIGDVHPGVERSEIEHGPHQRWAGGGNVGERRAPSSYRAALRAEGAGDGQIRIKVCGGDADASGRGCKKSFGLLNIGPTPKELQRRSYGDARREGGNGPCARKFRGHIFRVSAKQNRDDVFGGVDVALERRNRRFEGRQLALREGDVEIVGDAFLGAGLDKIQIALCCVDALARHGKSGLERSQIKIGPRDIRHDRDEDAFAIIGGRFGVIERRLDLAPVFAENVEVPAPREAGDLIDSLVACRVGGGVQRRIDPRARIVRSRSNAF